MLIKVVIGWSKFVCKISGLGGGLGGDDGGPDKIKFLCHHYNLFNGSGGERGMLQSTGFLS